MRLKGVAPWQAMMVHYAKTVRQALRKRPMTVSDILFHSALPPTKREAVVRALQAGLADGTVVQDLHVTDPRLYGGPHMYRLSGRAIPEP